MSTILGKMGKAQDRAIAELLSAGVFKTKTEILRAGVMSVHKEYEGIIIKEIGDPLARRKMQKILDEVKNGTRKVYSAEEMREKYPELP